MDVKLEFKGMASIKIKRVGETITLTLPSYTKMVLGKIPEDQEITFSAHTVLAGLASMLKKVSDDE